MDSETLRRMMTGAARWLEANAASVNALNVFPVPDGDTGTNMSLTLKAGVDAMAAAPDDARRALAHGALLGARGNSGVILSQWLAGFADAFPDGLKPALRAASDRAYKALAEPVEGTILTVVRGAADAARGSETEELLETALDGARGALARTPELLPVLREAGVVDAGGQGIVLMLEGALAELQGKALWPVAGFGAIDDGWLAEAQHAGSFGYCTEFVIQAEALSPDAVRDQISSLGDSLLVVGDAGTIRVHIHTADPGAALSLGVSLGTLHRIKIDNMTEQSVRLAETERAAGTLPVVAVVPGEGLAKVYKSMGAARIVAGGQTMNPSTQEMAQAVEAVDAPAVLILPNNPNVVAAAEQVAQVVGKQVEVVPSRTVAQGIAALLAYNPEESVEENARTMVARLESVHTVEVTRAVRDASMDGVSIKQGQYLGLVERKPTAAGNTPGEAMDRALDELELEAGYLVTLYYGEGVTSDEASILARALRERPDTPEVEVVWGGQPHYQYIASVEP